MKIWQISKSNLTGRKSLSVRLFAFPEPLNLYHERGTIPGLGRQAQARVDESARSLQKGG